MIFIDGSNMYHSLKAYFKRTDIDLGCFCGKLTGERRLVRIYYYNASVGQTEEPERYLDQQKFFASVAAIPYTELRLGRLVYTNAWPSAPPYEKGVDVQLATDMLTMPSRTITIPPSWWRVTTISWVRCRPSRITARMSKWPFSGRKIPRNCCATWPTGSSRSTLR